VWVTDGGRSVRKITGADIVTIGGRPHSPGSQDGRGWEARFSEYFERYLAVDKSGKLRIASDGHIFSAESSQIITAHPSSVLANRGDLVTFNVNATSPKSTYQWSFNGASIKGATNNSYTVLASKASVGEYAVEVASGSVAETSEAAQLSIRRKAK